MARRLRKLAQDSQSFLSAYTDGFDSHDLRRLFNRDVSHVYAVLTREQQQPEPQEPVQRFFHRVKLVFLGLSFKLTPARRMLFVLSLAAAACGFIFVQVAELSSGIRIDFSPIWYMISISGLLFLLSLELVDRVHVRDEIEVARQLQRQLLPQHSPPISGYVFEHSYRTANDIGGDYYDFLPLDDGRWALVIADASGHGMAAGLLMAITNATLKLGIDLDPEPLKVVELVNRALVRTSDRRSFVTLFYGLLDPEHGTLDFVSAGHPFPMVRRATSGEVEELGRGALPLGVRKELQLTTGSTRLLPGDLLLLYTDGLPEATVDPGQDDFGFERLRHILAASVTADQAHRGLVDAFHGYMGNEPLRDDVSLVVVQRMEPLPPLPKLPVVEAPVSENVPSES